MEWTWVKYSFGGFSLYILFLYQREPVCYNMWSNFNFFVIKKTLYNMPISFSLIIWGCVFGCVCVSRSVVSNSLQPHRLWPTRLFCAWDSPGKNTAMGCHFLLQRIFPTQGSNPSLAHCRQMLYRLSHQGSPDYMVSSQFSRSVVSNSLWPHESQHARLPCPSLAPRTCSNSCSLCWWCHPTISFSVTTFFSCPQSFPVSGTFPMSWFFASSG